jgi:hypothetical protein
MIDVSGNRVVARLIRLRDDAVKLRDDAMHWSFDHWQHSFDRWQHEAVNMVESTLDDTGWTISSRLSGPTFSVGDTLAHIAMTDDGQYAVAFAGSDAEPYGFAHFDDAIDYVAEYLWSVRLGWTDSAALDF